MEAKMTNPVIYVFINKSLHMTAGKISAQAVHAAMKSVIRSTEQHRESWDISIHKTVIILEARDENHIKSISKYLFDRGFNTWDIIDEGVNEIDPHVYTALASAIIDKDDQRTIDAFSTFNLYKDTIKINMEFEK